MIDNATDLQHLVDRARGAGAVAIDTEFVWERTFYPNLGVVQIGLAPDNVHLLDAQALDLAPLGALLADADVVKVLHDAVQDLTILRRATGSDPRNVFDTQLASGFVGLGASISLQGLMAEVVNVRLDKGATRSDWLQRPLTEAQISYAADDVRYLLQAYESLKGMLRKRGRDAWAAEEMAVLDDPSTYQEDDPQDRYQNVRGSGKRGFGSREFAVLREVAAWREVAARKANRPRGHVIDDAALVAIAQRKPDSIEKLQRLRGVPDRTVERYGEEIVAAVREALESPKAEWPQTPQRRPENPTLLPKLDLAQALLRGRSEREGIDSSLLANRADVEALVADEGRASDMHALLRGWRYEFVGADLEALLARKAAIALDEGGLPQIVPVAEL